MEQVTIARWSKMAKRFGAPAIVGKKAWKQLLQQQLKNQRELFTIRASSLVHSKPSFVRFSIGVGFVELGLWLPRNSMLVNGA